MAAPDKAAWYGCTGIIKILLEKGADANARDKNGRTPLHQAMWDGYNKREIIELLVSHGADINAKDNEGQTPLHRAINNIYIEKIFKILLGNGADVNATISKTGQTVLDLALQSKKVKLAWFLRSYGAKTYKELEAEKKAGANK